jgi:hypothetical protein
MYTLGLEDSESVTPAMVLVNVMDPVLMFGPAALRDLGPDATEEAVRHMFLSMGRGALLNIGTNLEAERFTKALGRLAYEGTVTARIPETKAKGMLIRGSRAIYMVVLIAPPAKLAEYQKVMEQNLEIEDALDGAPGARR